MTNIAVITTFPNDMWNVYAERMLQSYVQYWPKEIPLLVQLDDDTLFSACDKILRPQDAIAVGREPEHAAFIERNKDKDDPTNYRKQAVRFCHKVFAIHRALGAAKRQKEAGQTSPRYLIWMDADVVTTKPVSFADIERCLPKEGDAVAYLGRKDWDHSECGWLAFDLENKGDQIIQFVYDQYIHDAVFELPQWHDSWIWDSVISENSCTNLTEGKSGMEIWPQSPMASWSIHYKGPAAKQQLNPQPKNGQNFVIQTRNSIPNEEIRQHIEENQTLIKNWLVACEENNEEIVVVSGGPLLIAEEVRKEVKAGKKIIAVKHALERLESAGIIPWATILLDPREHVKNFVEKPDTRVKWFVASQVNPEVTKRLLNAGCEVWGYHASVGAGETELTAKQANAIVSGGSATATRGLYLLNHLGFRKFRLYGYDLCFPNKPDMNMKDDIGQPKYLEFSVGMHNPYVSLKRNFYTEPQLIAQFEEMNDIIKLGKWELAAFGDGIVPFILKLSETTRLRMEEEKYKMGRKLASYKELWNKPKKIRLSKVLRGISSITHHRLTANSK